MGVARFTFFALSFFLIINVSWSSNYSLPSYLKPCPLHMSPGDMNLCITDNVRAALPYYIEGASGQNVQTLDPLKVVKLELEIRSPPLKVTVLNGLMYGSRHLNVAASRTDFTLENSEFDLKVPILNLRGDYDASGSFLFIPISSQGKINITAVDVDFTVKTHFTRMVMNDGLEHIRMRQVGVRVNNIGRAWYYLDNLLPGEMNEELNKALNDDWESITSETMPSVAATFSPMFKSIIGSLLQPYPFNALFPSN